MKFGLSEQQYNYIFDEVIKPLEKMNAAVWCFGSRARGDHQRFSDLDLMIEARANLSREIGKILERLQEGNFPFKIDLVQLSDFADSYKTNYMQERVRF